MWKKVGVVMELEEAKLRIKYLIKDGCSCEECLKRKEAYKIILKALEELQSNSIPKKVIEDKIEELQEYIITLEKQQNEIISLGGDDLHIREQIWEVEEQIKILQDLLKGEKDENSR